MKRFLTSFALCAVGVIGLSGQARAAGSNTVTASNPSNGEVVNVLPTQVQMVFQNPLSPADVSAMALSLACDSKLVSLGAAQLAADNVSVSAPLTQLPGNGKCTVSWKLPDESTGTFSFTIQGVAETTTTGPNGEVPDTTLPPGVTQSDTSQPGRLGGPIGLLRLLSYVFVSAVLGGALFMLTRWPEGTAIRSAIQHIRLASIGAVVSLIFQVSFATAQYTNSDITSCFFPVKWFELMGSQNGRGLVMRVFLMTGVAFFLWIPQRILDPTFQPPALILIGLTIASYGFDRAGGRLYAIGVLISIVHMLFATAWTGSVILIARVILKKPGDAHLVNALTEWCRASAPLTIGLLLTGLIQTWRIDGFSLINSGHGRVVILKLMVVVALFIVERALREFIVKGLRRAKELTARSIFRMQRAATVQLAATCVVLALSSWLLAMRPPNVLPEEKRDKTTYPISQDLIGNDGFHVRLSVSPGNIGKNMVLIELFAPKRIQDFVVKLTPANQAFSGYMIFVPITRPGAALLSAEQAMDLRAAGQWNVEMTGTTTTGVLQPLTTSFIIADGTTVTTLPPNGGSNTTQPPAPSVPSSGDTTTTTTTVAG